MEFIYLPHFLKKLQQLSRKYPSFKNDFEQRLLQLRQNPQIGTPLGKNCYKIRLAIKSKGQGKSGGARVITCVKIERNKIYFFSMYDKSEQSAISDKDLMVFIDYIQKYYQEK